MLGAYPSVFGDRVPRYPGQPGPRLAQVCAVTGYGPDHSEEDVSGHIRDVAWIVQSASNVLAHEREVVAVEGVELLRLHRDGLHVASLSPGHHVLTSPRDHRALQEPACDCTVPQSE